MSVYIVEDNLEDLKKLQVTIEELGHKCIGSSDDSFEAQEQIGMLKPDVVLMEVDLNGKQSGITLARRIKSLYKVPILFISSNTNSDIVSKAADINPIGYLTKPINKNDLKAAMILAQNHVPKQMGKKKELSNIFIKSGNKLIKVVIDSILFAYTDSKNYCSIITSDKKKLSVRHSVMGLHKQLDNTTFIQTHRSYIINWQKVDFFYESDQTIEIEGHHIPVGRTFKEEVYKRLKVI
ncbi:response regulator transcription factor [Aquimarina sp. MMG016]|uniref:LytR/AlgR family response regulator transcription factor n=1 Tax=Aquimarina sp. MMG016 TaxID=2822690 RepID=UPI001B39DE2F|nr:response regulator transcription factor [Aquimarina sp. MMG016]MBQ4821217.1 response regulator transcription factor [Aquimarina sp. MMG016]